MSLRQFVIVRGRIEIDGCFYDAALSASGRRVFISADLPAPDLSGVLAALFKQRRSRPRRRLLPCRQRAASASKRR